MIRGFSGFKGWSSGQLARLFQRIVQREKLPLEFTAALNAGRFFVISKWAFSFAFRVTVLISGKHTPFDCCSRSWALDHRHNLRFTQTVMPSTITQNFRNDASDIELRKVRFARTSGLNVLDWNFGILYRTSSDGSIWSCIASVAFLWQAFKLRKIKKEEATPNAIRKRPSRLKLLT